MHMAGYDPRALADFFQKLEQQGGGGGGPQFLSDHPNPGNRQAAIDKEVSNWPPKNYLRNSQAFIRAKQDASTVKTYTGEQIAAGAKQGVWAQQNRQGGAIPTNVPTSSNQTAGGNLENVSYPQIRPTGNMKQLQHSAFSISYPENWQVSGDQQSTVTIAPQAGVGQGGIAYGVVIGGAQDSNATSLDQATADLGSAPAASPAVTAPARRLRREIFLAIVGSSVSELFNFLRAVYIFINLSYRFFQPLRERDWLVTVARPQGGLLYLVFIAPDTDFGQLRSTYERMLNSLQVQ